MKDNRSIGIFDSGLGGLSVLSALKALYPNESYVYLGDTARLPYGTKSPETVTRYALENSAFLLRKAELKLLIVACNTASAFALPELAKRFNIPVVGVVDAGVQQVLKTPNLNSVLLLATEATVRSEAYVKSLRAGGFKGDITSKACSLFVPLVEEGLLEGEVVQSVFEYHLKALPKEIDSVILGCTHYPWLLKSLKEFLPDKKLWVNSGSAIANLISFEAADRPPVETKYLVTDAPGRFLEQSALFLNESVLEKQIELVSVEC